MVPALVVSIFHFRIMLYMYLLQTSASLKTSAAASKDSVSSDKKTSVSPASTASAAASSSGGGKSNKCEQSTVTQTEELLRRTPSRQASGVLLKIAYQKPSRQASGVLLIELVIHCGKVGLSFVVVGLYACKLCTHGLNFYHE